MIGAVRIVNSVTTMSTHSSWAIKWNGIKNCDHSADQKHEADSQKARNSAFEKGFFPAFLVFSHQEVIERIVIPVISSK